MSATRNKPDMRGPDLAYTNDAARSLEQSVKSMMRAYNNDLHALLTNRRDLVEYIDALETESRQAQRDALNLIDDVLLTAPAWDGLEQARAEYMTLVARYEGLHGCLECGRYEGHEPDCSRQAVA